MAKVIPDPLAPDAFPRVRGVFLTRPMPIGHVAQKWPRKRPEQGRKPWQFYRQQEFAIAALWTKWVHPYEYETARRMAIGTQLVPRDLLMRAIMGLAYEVTTPEVGTWPAARHMSTNVQYILDLVTDVVGSLLWRSPVGWIAIPPGNAGQVLTFVAGSPEWADPSGGGGGGTVVNMPPDTAVPSTGWTQFNTKAGDVFATTSNTLHFKRENSSGEWGGVVRSAPATPYTITARLRSLVFIPTNLFSGVGLGFRQSSSSKLHIIELTNDSQRITHAVQRWTNNATFSANDYQVGSGIDAYSWFRVQDDGTNLKFSASMNGYDYFQLASVARGTFMTGGPDQVGLFLRSSTGSSLTMLDALSWLQA